MAAVKPPPEESQDGAPEWMMTFSDCMTLLLTFFVLLLSFSSFDDNVFRKLTTSIAEALPSVGLTRKQKEAFLPTELIKYEQEVDSGSEKPVQDGDKDTSMEQTELQEDFRNKNTFVTGSEKIFWGDGRVLSLKGRILMGIIADFLKQMPNKVMICEKPAAASATDDDYGLKRAWSIVDYLCKKCGLEYEKFVISASGAVGDGDGGSGDLGGRTLQIVLLERGLGD